MYPESHNEMAYLVHVSCVRDSGSRLGVWKTIVIDYAGMPRVQRVKDCVPGCRTNTDCVNLPEYGRCHHCGDEFK